MKSLVLTILLALPAMAAAEEDGSGAVVAAKAATTVWLSLVDLGDYESSWEAAAPLFQAAVTKPEWRRSLNAARAPLGDLLFRQVVSSNYRTTLPGAPDGEYVVFTFEASFAHKAQAVETVTAMLVSPGDWRVAGYYIK